MANQNEPKNDIYPVLQEILRWTRVIGISLVSERFQTEIGSDPKELLLYHLSDGNNSARDIAAQIHLDKANVVRRWRKWARFGIVQPSLRFEGRWQKVIDLEELGIDAPKLNDSTSTQLEAEASVPDLR